MPDLTFTVRGKVLDAALVLTGSLVVGLIIFAAEGFAAGVTTTVTAIGALSAFVRVFLR